MDKGVVKRYIAVPDQHFPLHDQPALNVVKKAIQMIKPTGFINLGDIGEWHAFSAWRFKRKKAPPIEYLIDDFDKDVKDVNAGMDQWDEVLDKANVKEKYVTEGNHDNWLNYAADKYYGCDHYKFKNAVKLKERGYKYYQFGRKLKIGKLYFYHGHELGGQYHTANHLRKKGANYMYGHWHDLQHMTVTHQDGPKAAWSIGCLKDMSPKANDWLHHREHNWAHAFAIIDYYRGGNFTVHVVQIIKGKTSLWGELIDGNKK